VSVPYHQSVAAGVPLKTCEPQANIASRPLSDIIESGDSVAVFSELFQLAARVCRVSRVWSDVLLSVRPEHESGEAAAEDTGESGERVG